MGSESGRGNDGATSLDHTATEEVHGAQYDRPGKQADSGPPTMELASHMIASSDGLPASRGAATVDVKLA